MAAAEQAKGAATPAAAGPAGIEKAAILLLTLGSDVAAGVLGHLTESEVRQVSSAISRMRSIPHEQAAIVHEEAWRRLSNEEALVVDGERFAGQLAGSVQPLALPVPEVADPEFLAASFEGVPPRAFAEVLGREHPQVVALTLAHLRSRQAADVLVALPEDVQADVVHRMLDLQEVPVETLGEVRDALTRQVQQLGGAAAPGASSATTKRVADLMNAVDDGVEERVFAHLESVAPEVAEQVRGLMFTFDDLLRLDNRSMQTVLKEAPREDLVLAMKTASAAVRDLIFANMSQRAAEILRDDMSMLGPVKLKDVEKAQASVVAVVKRLESEQKITIAGGEGGDVVV
jgi:flagellar motor switch protein FliG